MRRMNGQALGCRPDPCPGIMQVHGGSFRAACDLWLIKRGLPTNDGSFRKRTAQEIQQRRAEKRRAAR